MSKNASHVLLAGDLNCHFERNTAFTNVVKTWIQQKNLTLFWTCNNDKISPVDYTFINTSYDPIAYSTLDHFAASQSMLEGLTEAGVIHDGSNPSNHSPIFAKFEVGKIEVQSNTQIKCDRVCWENATNEAKDNFKNTFKLKLDALSYKHECWDINCSSEDHIEEIEDYTLSVLPAMESAGIECLPSSGPIRSG